MFFKKNMHPPTHDPYVAILKSVNFLIRYQYLSKQTSKQLLFQDNKLTYNLYLSNKRFSRYLYWSNLVYQLSMQPPTDDQLMQKDTCIYAPFLQRKKIMEKKPIISVEMVRISYVERQTLCC